jgi:hypothetical protein
MNWDIAFNIRKSHQFWEIGSLMLGNLPKVEIEILFARDSTA